MAEPAVSTATDRYLGQPDRNRLGRAVGRPRGQAHVVFTCRDSATPKLARYAKVEAHGHYDDSRQVLIDNMVNGESPGYFVITPFALRDGGWLLVNRGWVPLGSSRAQRPAVPVNSDERTLRGRADNLPSPGIRMGTPAPLQPPYPVVAAFPTHQEIARLLQEPRWAAATDLVLLDPAEPDGYVRNWTPPGFPPR